MLKLFADAGTSWTKTIELFDCNEELKDSPLEPLIKKYSVDTTITDSINSKSNKVTIRRGLIPTKVFNQNKEIHFDAATGHMSIKRIKKGGKYKNELVALALGGRKHIEDSHATIVDLGSRDSKWIRYKDYKYQDLDWNGTCGSGTGATIEMVCNFYDIKMDKLQAEEEKIAVTCGVFGMEKIMDQIAHGELPDKAVSRYIHGIAFNVWNFAQCPQKIYLSGGLCLNNCFVQSLNKYCEVVTIGRYLLIEGLY